MAQFRPENGGGMVYEDESEMAGPSVSGIEGEGYEDGPGDWELSSHDKCNLIINYLPHDIDDITLKNIFAEHGEIAAAKVVKDKNTKKSLGYGFIKFLNFEDACDAIQKKNGLTIGHKVIKVSVARPPSDDIRNCKLYITNLPKDYTEVEVVDLFRQFGEIIECRVLKDRNSKSNRGVAFVQFNVKIQANNALSLNGFRPPGCDRNLVVKYAEDQHKRKDRRMGMGMGMVPGGVMSSAMSPIGVIGHPQGHLMKAMDMHRGMEHYQYFPHGAGRGVVGGGPNTSGGLPLSAGTGVGSPLVGSHGMQQMQVLSGGMYMSQGGAGVMYQQVQGQGSPHLRGRGVGRSMGSPMAPEHPQQWYSQVPAQISYDSRGAALMQSLGHPSDMQPVSFEAMDMVSPMSHTHSPHHTTVHRSGPGPSTAGGVYMRQQRAPAMDAYSGSVTLVISNLPAQSDVALLHELLAPYGRILSAQIDVMDSPQDATGTPRQGICSGRGHVQMAGMAAAQFAVQALHGAIVFEGAEPLQVSVSFGSNASAGAAVRSMSVPQPSLVSGPGNHSHPQGPTVSGHQMPYAYMPPLPPQQSQVRMSAGGVRPAGL